MPDKGNHQTSSKAHGKAIKEKRAAKHAREEAKLHPDIEDLTKKRH